MNDYKRIPMEHLQNCRDLGGYGCAGQGFFAYHKLFRADVPDQLEAGEWKLLTDMGIRTVIDLRSISEQRYMPYEVPAEMTRISLPLMKEEVLLNQGHLMEKESMGTFCRSLIEGYSSILRDNAAQVVNVLNAVITALDSGAVLYHCTAGKDRTGVISAVIYLLCGVCREDIIADYQVTATYIKQKEFLAQIPEEMKALCISLPETMEQLLDRVEQEHLLDHLYKEGLTAEAVERLRRAVVMAVVTRES